MSKTQSFIDTVDQIASYGIDKNIFHLYTDMHMPVQGNQIFLTGKCVTNFGSCSYLGLEFDERVKNASKEAIDKYGTQFSESRAYVSVGLYKELENLFEKLFEAWVVVAPTTTLGHFATIPVLVSTEDCIIMDHQVHNSVQMAVNMVKSNGVHVELLRHNRIDLLEDRIKELRNKYKRIFEETSDGIFITDSNGVGGDSDVSPSTGRTGIINLSANEVDLTVDAGIRVTLPATIGNKVWADVDTDGVQDANEPGIGGVLVTLFNSSNQPIGSAITDGNGNWQITNVPPGTGYYVIFTANLPGFDVSGAPGTNPAWTAQNIGANGTQALDSGTESDTDSDVTASGVNAGRTGTFSIVPGNNFPNIDAGIINWPIGNILPIQLVSFTAQPQANAVVLNWVVDAETNVATYEVEYSTNRVIFTSIGLRAATGSRTYSLLHGTPQQGLNYYRLKITDKDGKVSYSEIRKVNMGNLGVAVKLYPMPAVDNINITVSSTMVNQSASIQILSVDGRLVHQQTTNALSQTETININKLASGKYIVRLITNNNVVNLQMQIVK